MTDLLLTGGLILDGSGAPAFPGFVAVRGGRIQRLGLEGEPEPEAATRIDAAGRAVCPGVVDVHSHRDLLPFVEPSMDGAIRQGVTTLVVGNCGSSAAPAAGAPELAAMIGVDPSEIDLGWDSCAQFLDSLDACRPAVNVATLIGHGALRMAAMGLERRAPTLDELATMHRLLAEGMEAGAVGMSTGLVYIPGMYADTEELVSLASGLARHDGVYASHIRAEGELLFEAVGEAIEIGRRAGVPAHISHLKLESELAWGRADELLATIRAARDEGVDVTADQYPYTAWASLLQSFLPPWSPPEDLTRILADPSERERLVRSVEQGEEGWQSSVKGVGWERIVVERHAAGSMVEGRSVADVADERGEDPTLTALALLVDDPDTGAIGHSMREDDVRTILASEGVMVASDGWGTSPDGPLGRSPIHPRNYGTFPRVLGPYVRDGVLSLETAVRKMTSLPADRFGLTDRGRIETGAAADLLVFDPARVRDVATFEDPHRFPEGIELVIVNGSVAWSAGKGNGERAGQVLRRGKTSRAPLR